MRNYPDFIEAFLQSNSTMGVPERYKVWSAISIVAGALERKVWVVHEHFTLYPNLYVVLIGSPGIGKSTAAEKAADILANVVGISFMGNRINEASFLNRLEKTSEWKQFHLEGKTYPHSACFLFASEAATSFSEMYPGSGITHTLTDLFNCGPQGWSTIRGFEKETVKKGIQMICNPCINILACTTSTWFTSKMVTKEDALGGFGSRLIVVNHKGTEIRDNTWRDPSMKSHGTNKNLVQELSHINSIKGPFVPTDGWREAYKEISDRYQQHRNELLTSEIMTSVAQRKQTQAVKVSMILAASRSDSLTLEADDFIKAWELLTGLEDNIEDAYSGIIEDPENKVAKEILDFLHKKKLTEFTRAHIVDVFRAKHGTKKISKALEEMASGGLIKHSVYDIHGRGHTQLTYKLEHVTEVP